MEKLDHKLFKITPKIKEVLTIITSIIAIYLFVKSLYFNDFTKLKFKITKSYVVQFDSVKYENSNYNVWKYFITFKNKGPQTIYGIGKKKNIYTDRIVIQADNNYIFFKDSILEVSPNSRSRAFITRAPFPAGADMLSGPFYFNAFFLYIHRPLI